MVIYLSVNMFITFVLLYSYFNNYLINNFNAFSFYILYAYTVWLQISAVLNFLDLRNSLVFRNLQIVDEYSASITT